MLYVEWLTSMNCIHTSVSYVYMRAACVRVHAEVCRHVYNPCTLSTCKYSMWYLLELLSFCFMMALMGRTAVQCGQGERFELALCWIAVQSRPTTGLGP